MFSLESLRNRFQPKEDPSYQKILEALDIWVENHPNPGEQVRYIPETGKSWSPLSYADEVRRKTKEGHEIVQGIIDLANDSPGGLDELLQRLVKPTVPQDKPSKPFILDI